MTYVKRLKGTNAFQDNIVLTKPEGTRNHNHITISLYSQLTQVFSFFDEEQSSLAIKSDNMVKYL